MADLLSRKNMIFQKFTTTFTETFAGGTGPFLGGIFFGSPIHCLDCWWDGLAVSPKLEADSSKSDTVSSKFDAVSSKFDAVSSKFDDAKVGISL
jgi:hypothetical protein